MKLKKILATTLSIVMLSSAMTISANCGTPTREDIITSIYTLKGVSSENSNYGNNFSEDTPLSV